MGVRRMVITQPCPACGQQRLLYTAADLDIPYFGQTIETLILCQACGFKHADVIIGKTQTPTRFTYQVDSADDMSVRVVRSTSGTIRIPELGAVVEPGPNSEAYVSNVEGVLNRFERIVNQLGRDAQEPEQQRRVEQRLAQIADAKEGRFPFTLVVEDPYGNSLVAHEDVVQETIPEEEAEELARGEITIDVEPEDLEEVLGDVGGDGAPVDGAPPSAGDDGDRDEDKTE